MQINQSEIKDLMAVVTLTIEPADYQEEVAKQLKQVRQKAQMPGFRPGMVPAGLVKKMYGKGILADVLNKLVGENLQKHIEDNKLNVLGDPLPNNELTPALDFDMPKVLQSESSWQGQMYQGAGSCPKRCSLRIFLRQQDRFRLRILQ